MKRYCFVLLFLVTTLLSHAQTVYKEFEVDSVARPNGGIPLLEKFIDVNRRMPHAAEVSRTKGAVILSAIVETDGAVSDVKTLRSLRPDCDREAVRVLSLFKAWKPALKEGKPVRQQITYTIRFVPSTVQSETGAITTYYSKEGSPTVDESLIEFKLATPVDTTGFPNGKPVFYKREGKNWQKIVENGFERKAYTHHNPDDPTLPDSLPAYQLVTKDHQLQLDGMRYSFYQNGTLLAREQFNNGKQIGKSFYYYANGIVKRYEEFLEDGKIQEWSWYPNGQLRQVLSRKSVAMEDESTELFSQWDSTGRPLVQNGNGMARFQSRQNDKWITETGLIKDKRKEGDWRGRYEDGKPAYREFYQTGKCQSGTAYYGSDSVAYTDPWQHAEFKGGLKNLGQFLSTNISYPPEAARASIEGKVFISFVVCQDGSLCDYEIMKSVHPIVDKEALRVVKASNGKWKPGAIRGRNVRVKYNLPINFALQ